ncbi:MAG: 2-oxoacid:ferredoxin oxidoreductase subunit beta, partial [Pseudomonadota bacterium]|nr:2-oxoacid:ferredoxin oxidoreductase subunit beta [Pseudomonadota bacterium]
AAHDLHEHLNTVDAPINSLQSAQLCPGKAALDKINRSLR